MAAAQRAGGRAPKRLRQLESVAGRGLLLGCGTKQQAPAAHYVVLAARCPSVAAAEDGAAGSSSSGEDEWRIIYRSEALDGTSNPEWRPLAWGEQQLLQHDPLLDSSSVQLLLALHALEPAGAPGRAVGGTAAGGAAGAAAAAAAEARAAGDGQQAAGGLDSPFMFAAAERPAFRLPAPPLPPHGSSSEPASRSASVSAEAEEPAPPEAFDAQQAAGAAAALPPVAAAGGSGQQQQQEGHPAQQEGQQQQIQKADDSQQQVEDSKQQQQQQQQQQNGLYAGAQPQAMQQQQQQPASKSQASTPAVAEATKAAAAQASTAGAAADTPAPPAADDWVPAAAAALAGTGTCPGRLVAAWRLGSLSDLFPAWPDLAGLRQPLQPDTLVLSFGSAGLCLCPPPLQQESGSSTAPSSLQASPLKRSQLPSATATAGDERGEGGGPGPGRRFASLLVSKLLRSTANLQEAASLGSHADLAAELAGASSDAESEDAGSDVTSTTAATRRKTATAPSELPGTAAAAWQAAAGAVPGSSGRDGSARTAAAGAAATAAAAAAAAGSSSGALKTITLASAHHCVSSLVALQSRLRDLAGRSQALQQQLGQRLEPQQQRRRQDAALAALAEEAARCRRQAAEVEQQVAEVQAVAAAAKKQATVRAQALVTVLKVMVAADRRVSEAEAALRGEEGRGALTAVLRELVARRCQMVCQLGAIFRLGPTAVSIPQAPPGGFLEDRLERQWAGGTTSEGGMSGGGGGGGGMLSLAAAAGAGRYGSSSFGLDGFGSGPEGTSKYRQEMRLSIGGLEVRPSVWRKAFDDGGYESDAAEDRAAGVALGYVAQMVDRLAAYLDVPLRYPLALRGSRSAIIDSYPPAGTWADAEEEGGAKRPLFGRGGGDAAAAAAAQRVEYPLYCDSNRERPRFAVGVFLLNKDVIQLLQAHGISAAGPNHLLHNLHKLLLAAQSGLPAPRALPAA